MAHHRPDARYILRREEDGAASFDDLGGGSFGKTRRTGSISAGGRSILRAEATQQVSADMRRARASRIAWVTERLRYGGRQSSPSLKETFRAKPSSVNLMRRRGDGSTRGLFPARKYN